MTSQWRHRNKAHSCYSELNYVQNLYFGFFIFWKLTELCRFVTYLWNDPRSCYCTRAACCWVLEVEQLSRVDWVTKTYLESSPVCFVLLVAVAGGNEHCLMWCLHVCVCMCVCMCLYVWRWSCLFTLCLQFGESISLKQSVQTFLILIASS